MAIARRNHPPRSCTSGYAATDTIAEHKRKGEGAVTRSLLLLVLLIAPAVSVHAQLPDLGHAVAISGNQLLVGQPAGKDASGTVRILSIASAGGTAAREMELGTSRSAPGDLFGYALAEDAGRLAAGAPGDGGGSGSIYLFEYPQDTGTWVFEAKLDAEDSAPRGGVGRSLFLQGSLLVAGANDAALVYRRQEEAWKLVQVLEPESEGEEFGYSVTAGQSRIYVGAPARENGAVYVFGLRDEAYMREAVLMRADPALSRLGSALVASDSGVLFAGAPAMVLDPRRQAGPRLQGAIVLLRPGPDGAWSAVALSPTGGSRMDMFGNSLAISGGTLVVGAPGARGFRGSVYQYELTNDGALFQERRLLGEPDDRFFGFSVAMGGDAALVGSPGAYDGKGAAVLISAGSAAADPEIKARIAPDTTRSVLNSECEDGLAGPFPCDGVDLLSFVPLRSLGNNPGMRLNDVWGWTDPESGREYALVGRTDGTAFVDISDPYRPRVVGELPMTAGAEESTWRDIKVYSNYAFIVADLAGEHGMQVFDLAQLREAEESPATFAATAIYSGIHSAHNIVINEASGFAFAVGANGGGATCGGGLHMIDIRMPLEPVFAGCFADTDTGRRGTGATHDAQCVIYAGPDLEHRGKEICFGANETALSIADVTDKERPASLSSSAYPNVGCAHQGWLSEDRRHFFINDEHDEMMGRIAGTRTLIWDVSDLDDPALVREFVAENLASDHNLYIRDDRMYQANYTSGLRIFDVSDARNPVPFGFLDTEPLGPDRPAMSGAWSAYPFFESGTIVVTSMTGGLFLLRERPTDS